MSVPQRILSSTVAFAISWTLVAVVCVVFGMNDGDAVAYGAASASAGLLLGDWWRNRAVEGGSGDA